MRLNEVISVLDTLAPFESAEAWDNVGLMVGDPRQEISSILVALDPSSDVIEHARMTKADLIITHHPLIFSPLKRLDFSESVSRKINRLITSGLSLVSMHTNLDAAEHGIADVLAEALSLKGIQSFGMMRIGAIMKERSLRAWAGSLPFQTVRIVDAARPVKKVCACPGSGSEYLWKARELGCDTLVTGDVKYHAALDAQEAGINIVDPGHFGTEQIAVKPFAQKLGTELPGIEVKAYETRDVFTNIKGENN